MRTGFSPFIIAAAALLALANVAQAQHVGSTANRAPPSTAQFSARAASDAAQALDMAATPGWQAAPLLGPDGKLQKSGSNTAGLYDRQSLAPDKKNAGAFDPNSIHYPYGRASLGNVDPTSAANPYSPYGSLPNYNYGSPASPLTPPATAGVFRGGLPSSGRH